MRDDRRSEQGSAGVMFGLLSILFASVIGVIIFAFTISPPSSNGNDNSSSALLPLVGSVSTLPGGSSEGSGLAGVPSAAQAAACEADAKTVEVALLAYQAHNGAFPTPPSPWSAASYAADYAPLTSTGSTGGPYLSVAIPGTTHYVVEYDSAGHVWVEPPGQYDTSYNPGHSVDVPTACSGVAH